MQQSERVQQWFHNAGTRIIAWRWPVIFIFVLITILAIMGITRVLIVTSYDNWFLEDDPIKVAQQTFKEVFGNDSYVAMLIEADDVFAPDTLRMIRTLGEELEEDVPYADEIVSLAQFEFTRATEDGVEIGDLLPEEIPNDPDAVETIRAQAFSKDFWVNRLFSDDGKQAWMILRLQPYPEKKDPQDAEPYTRIAQAVATILAQDQYAQYTIKTTGRPILLHEQQAFFRKEGIRIISLACLMATVILFLALRSVKDVVIPLVTSGSSLVWVFGAMGWLGVVIDAIVLTLPVYLGLALGIGYFIHLFNFFKTQFGRTGQRQASVVYAVEQTGWPMFFTSLTTIAAMAAFYIVPVKLVQWMGMSCAVTVLTLYILNMTLTPVLLSFGKNQDASASAPDEQETWVEHFFASSSDWFLTHSKGILLVFAVLVIVLLFGLTRIRVNMDYTHTYGLKIPFIATIHEISQSKVGAYQSYNLSLTFPEHNAAKTPDTLQKFDLLASEIQTFPLVKRVSSLLDIIKDMNQVMHDNESAYYRIPDEQGLLSQLLLLYEISAGAESEHWVDYDYTTMRMMIEITDFDSSEIERQFRDLEQRAQELFPEAEFSVVGTVVQISVAQNYITKGEVRSFLIALVIIGVLMMLVFQSVKTGLIGMIPNMVPALVVGGVMGYGNISLDMLTMMIIPMLLGLAVDDTIHFITHCQTEIQKMGSYPDGIRSTFKIVGKSMLMTSLILMAAFSLYMTSITNFYFNLGILVMIGVFSALAADYFITPVLLYLIQPFSLKNVSPQSHKEMS